MQITEVNKAKGTKYHVLVDGEYWATLPGAVLSDYGIKPGLETDEAFLERVRHDADYRRAKERALYLLEYRDHSYGELIDKLCRNYDRAVAEEVADRMAELRLIDDEGYARRLIRNLIEVRGYGMARVKQELYKSGLAEIIEQTVLEYEYAEDPVDKLCALLRRKYEKDLEDPKGRQRVINALIRRGYDYDQIRTALRVCLEDET